MNDTDQDLKINKSMQVALKHHRAGRFRQAEAIYREVIRREPGHSDALHLLGVIAYQSGNADLAIKLINDAIKINGSSPFYYKNIGDVYREKKNYEKTLASYQEAILLKPDYTEAYNDLGVVYKELGKYDQAIGSYQKAISIDPNCAQAQNNLGTVFMEKGSYEQAIAFYQAAISSKPDYAEAYYNLGIVFQRQKMNDEALTSYQKAIEARPDLADAHINLGEVLRHQEKTAEAVESYRRALRIRPSSVSAKWGALLTLPSIFESVEQITKARNQWIDGVRELLATIKLRGPDEIEEAKNAAHDFTNFNLPYQGYNDRDLQILYGKLLSHIANAVYPEYMETTSRQRPSIGGKIRVGFVSSFFREHSVFKSHGHWITKLDAGKFEVFVFYLERVRDWATEEIAARADHFFTFYDSDELIKLIVGQDLHVLIYTDLGMEPRLQLVSALRLVPVQCSTWGHPVTSGLPTIDYFLSSDLMEPDDGEDHYAEELIRLPNLSSSYPYPQVSKAKTLSEDQRDSGKIFYLNLQNIIKLLPQHDEIYPRIVESVPDCVFGFLSHKSDYVTGKFRERLAAAFRLHELNAEDYCIFYPRMIQHEFFGLAKSADIILDGITWSGFNSSMEALAFDKPIVTLPGSTFRSRHTYAILRMINVTETIATDIDDYIRIAVLCGLDEAFRNEVIGKISRSKRHAFNDPEAIRGLEEFLLASIKQS